MRANYTVEKCRFWNRQSETMLHQKKYYIAAVEMDWDYSPSRTWEEQLHHGLKERYSTSFTRTHKSHLQTLLGKSHSTSLPAHLVLIGKGKRSWLAVFEGGWNPRLYLSSKLNPAITVVRRRRIGQTGKIGRWRDAERIVANDWQNWMIRLLLNFILELHLRRWRTPVAFNVIDAKTGYIPSVGGRLSVNNHINDTKPNTTASWVNCDRLWSSFKFYKFGTTWENFLFLAEI